jgi:type II secretory ATPase GspE/PulE/Tfp pilus assembly ATPase PilB-like protein
MNTGFRGRTGIFEVLTVTETIQSLMLKSSESNQLRQAAIREGMRTLRKDGVAKIIQGVTTIDEVLRVTQA